MKEIRSNSERIEKVEKHRKKIIQLLKTYEEEGKIEEYGYGRYSYWINVPYVRIEDQKIFLGKPYTYLGSAGITTIYDYTLNGAKNMIENIIKNKEKIKEEYIITYGEMLNIINKEEE